MDLGGSSSIVIEARLEFAHPATVSEYILFSAIYLTASASGCVFPAFLYVSYCSTVLLDCSRSIV